VTAARIDWLRTGLQEQHFPGTDEAFSLCEELTGRFKKDHGPMPVVVMHVTPPETAPGSSLLPDPVLVSARQVGQVSGIVEILHRIYGHGGMLCKRLPDRFGAASAFPRPAADLGRYEDALAMVHALSTSRGWENYRRSQYRPYSFPRSQLLAAIEEAVIENSPDGGRPDYDHVLSSLGTPRWRPAKPGESATRRVLASMISPATLIGALVLTALARFITAASLLWVLVSLAAAIVVIGLVLVAQQNFAPLSWLGSASQWFTTTTFIGPTSDDPDADDVRPPWLRLLPRRAWGVREARAGLVVRQLITA
jgi:hypothetical protein